MSCYFRGRSLEESPRRRRASYTPTVPSDPQANRVVWSPSGMVQGGCKDRGARRGARTCIAVCIAVEGRRRFSMGLGGSFERGRARGEALKRATARLKRTWPRTILRSAVLVSFTQQKGSANAPSHAVIPASQRRIDQLSAHDRHAKSPGGQRSGYCTRSQYFSQDRSKHVLKNHHNGRLSSGGEGG